MRWDSLTDFHEVRLWECGGKWNMLFMKLMASNGKRCLRVDGF